ncbi:DUF2383 domain-containing protein [Aestuariicoccus sp. MJ-SS9]|uniref:DUF2383 domain-containing protein n=1 Tax=Aestuariicoccus sp. MJ-SS9 TaxID=3079855 RepID=UPI00290D5418|nr:DUF2383 domain-containing protein [Aestuariicoccus sp. MJ-SS9]MDU8911371.1 DUF2383 domain-containing protein [Aestuariicoccus sp. MJ-SS9]
MPDSSYGQFAATGARIEALQALLTRSVDAQAGFDRMEELAKPEAREIVGLFRATHRRQIARVADLITELGGTPDKRPGILGRINRTVVTARALLARIDGNVLRSVRHGEEYVLCAFDRAIAISRGTSHGAELVAMQKELMQLMDRAERV